MSDTNNTKQPPNRFHKGNILLFLTSQTISLFGSSLVQFAIIWYITIQTKSGLTMAIATICSFLPQILISLFAGVWADRYPRKRLIMLADGFIALSTLLLLLLFSLGFQDLWLLFILSACRSLGSGIQTPAVSSLIPQLVPPENLMKVNGINSSLQASTLLIAPAVGGLLLNFIGLEATFLVDIITAIFGIGILSMLKIPTVIREVKATATSHFHEMKEGLHFVMKNKLIRSLIIFGGLFGFLISPAALLTPLLVARTFGDEVWRLTINEMAFSAGAVLGGILISIWGGFRNKIHTITLSAISFGILTFLLGVPSSFVFFMIVIGVTGIFLPFYNTPAIVLLQESVPEAVLGRVFSLVHIVTASSMPLGMLIFGPLSDIVSVELLMIITGILMTLMGISIFFNKSFKHPVK